MSGDAKPDTSHLNNMNPNVLQQYRMKLEQEMTVLTNSVQKLAEVQQEFERAKNSIQMRAKQDPNSKMFAPLGVEGVFVEAKHKNLDSVLIDIGTGYVVRYPNDQAVEYMERRSKFIEEQMAKMKEIGKQKYEEREEVVNRISSLVAHSERAAMGGKG